MYVMPSRISTLAFEQLRDIIVGAGYEPTDEEGPQCFPVLAVRHRDSRQKIIAHLQEACFDPANPVGSFNLAVELQRTSKDRTTPTGLNVVWWPALEWPEPLYDADR